MNIAEKYAAFEKMLLPKSAPEQNVVDVNSASFTKATFLKLASSENRVCEKLTSLKVVAAKLDSSENAAELKLVTFRNLVYAKLAILENVAWSKLAT